VTRLPGGASCCRHHHARRSPPRPPGSPAPRSRRATRTWRRTRRSARSAPPLHARHSSRVAVSPRAPWRLALTTIRRFAAGRADRQAADALRGRIDWQDVLRLDRADVGCDAAVLCAFRGRLLAGEAAWLLCETLE